ncbi:MULTISPECIES: NeuD/PglB/VioB family sugar acetyltransferase [unclassified Mesobacillus]|uniref:NeuD/PglB/VioB family sugar acetyltransferase n=1 Tax=unclassified Mesobacillus TaxID=2675270 RepID=UPI0020412570|nr:MULTISPECIES: NeuD/PglB/VioB family sugar acetyltransferase [unclassified Mesobacillus]MCM3124163.1 NeuD/PglB/VioB family sugar acetyltransferase [Mesobacillus sp. MER 33]MCM3234012.1 NeuD/PglB/VioB family sugar acetyltransferase [Mesobacillus sp. MER 48]
MEWKGLPIVIFGSGGISKETYYIIEEINFNNNTKVYDFLGFIEDNESKIGDEVINGYKVIASDNNFEEYTKDFALLGVVIPIGTPKVKSIIYNGIKSIENIVFPNIIHPNVKYDKNSVLMGKGNVFAAGVSLTCNINIGDFNLLNLNATVGHDTKIGDFNVINPLAAISGDINLSNLCLIGTGAKVLQQLTINNGATVGAGAVVVKDVEEKATVVGVPAKKIKS